MPFQFSSRWRALVSGQLYDKTVAGATLIDRERRIEPEQLDHAPPEEARRCLRDLARINRYFGGYRILRAALGQFVGTVDSFSMLDVGAASGETGIEVRRRYPHAEVCSLDRQASHLTPAPKPKVAADAFHLPFSTDSFDFVFSSLFLHHFPDEDVVSLLRDFSRVARRAVLAVDLERGPLAFHFLPATKWLFRWNDLFVADGLISVQAAFKREELQGLAFRAGLRSARVTTERPWGRLALVAPL